MNGRVFVGTSGWDYPDWSDGFYGGIPHHDRLAFYSHHFNTVEVNATFYHHQRKSTFEHWRDQTPVDFAFAIKGHRYLTHVKRLLDPDPPLQQSREAAAGLGGKLAVMLWQMPRSLHKDMVRLQNFAYALAAWPEVRHVLEFRHASWFDDEVAACLCANRIANCWSDAVDWPLWDAVTTDLVYLRLHGHVRTYASVYSDGELGDWVERVRGLQAQGRDAYIYFDNTAAGAALKNARRMKEILG
ncbi:MAG: DUF72 domain-containing protein [Gammaproteobacteria bacterium]|nr:DUF72 domain-containing protein [Gammaproteobacteria bacterium]MBU1978494.1 DUF72 domain-containing protein [Gammaproteobacteria bacterium]